MEDWSKYVLPDGSLNGAEVGKREMLYQGMNGRFVERFYPVPERSYIFKPLTNGESMDREAWVYRHVLNSFPAIFPNLLASSQEGAKEAGWSIFEDIGPLQHEYSLELAIEVVKQMAWWHAFPETHWEGLTNQGQKPPIEHIARDLKERREEAGTLLTEVGLAWEQVEVWIRALEERKTLPGSRVMSHGDLHLGNYAKASNGRLYILDWEHAHLNTPFWDLYHLIDMSHPLFPKRMDMSDREQILATYLGQSADYGVHWERDEFIRNYCGFSAVFSLWMLLLISGDLERGDSVWPRERLLVQREETEANLTGCLKRLSLAHGENESAGTY